MPLLHFPRYLSGLLLLGACGLLVFQLRSAELWQIAVVAGGLTVIWLVGLWQKRPGLASPCFIGLGVLNAVGVIVQGRVGTGLFCQVLLLGSWDLDYLATQATLLVEDADMEAFIMKHLRRLGTVLLAGLILGWVPMQVAITLPLFPALLVGFLFILTLYAFIGGMRRLNSGS